MCMTDQYYILMISLHNNFPITLLHDMYLLSYDNRSNMPSV